MALGVNIHHLYFTKTGRDKKTIKEIKIIHFILAKTHTYTHIHTHMYTST